VVQISICLGPPYVSQKESPYNEKEALSIQSSATRIAHEIANPTHPIVPLFDSPIDKKEVMDEMHRLTLDKFPGPDGVTNCMLRSGGEKLNTILHEVISTLWEYEAHPSAWQKSLMQPIYKGGNKLQSDPASYRGIYLCSALAKLLEGIINKRLTQYTEQRSTTLTDNQLGTRSNRQIHDTIYSIIAIMQHNFFANGQPTYVAFLDFFTSFPSVFREGLLCTMRERIIVGKTWHALRYRFNIVKIRVLHPKIRQRSEVKFSGDYKKGVG